MINYGRCGKSLSGFPLTRRCKRRIVGSAGRAVLRCDNGGDAPHDARAEHLEAFHLLPCITPLPHEAPTPDARVTLPHGEGHALVVYSLAVSGIEGLEVPAGRYPQILPPNRYGRQYHKSRERGVCA